MLKYLYVESQIVADSSFCDINFHVQTLNEYVSHHRKNVQ